MSTIPIAEKRAKAGGLRRGVTTFLPAEDGVTLALVTLLVIEYLSFGGNRNDLSLGFTLAYASLLAYALGAPWGRKSLSRLNGWSTAAALFGLVLLAIGLSLAPLPFGGNPTWRFVGRAPIAAINPFGAVLEGVKLLGLACVFTLAALLACERRRGLMMMKILVVYALGFGLICLILEALSPVNVFAWAKPTISRYRVSGVFSSANTAATVYGVNALLAAGGLLRGADRLGRRSPLRMLAEVLKFLPIELLAFLISVGCLLLSASRGGIAAFGVSFLVLVFWRLASPKGSNRVSLVILSVATLLLILVNGAFAIDRFFHAAFLNDSRTIWAMLAWKAFLASPAEGFGLGSLPLVFRSTLSPANYGVVSWAGSAHNVYLQWLSEAGLVGAIPMLALIAWLVWVSLAGVTRTSTAWRPALVCCTLLVLIHSVVEYSLQEPAIAALWSVLLGASMGLASQSRPPRRGRRRALAARGPGGEKLREANGEPGEPAEEIHGA